MSQFYQDNTRIVRITIVTLLLIGCIAVLLPFVGTLLLATVLCITTWPLYARLERRLGNRRSLAAIIACLVLILLVLLPMIGLSGALASSSETLIALLKPVIEKGLPGEAPGWLANLPLAGPELAAYWHKVAASRAELSNLLQQLYEPTRKVVLATVTIFGRGLLQMLLVIFFAFFIFRDARKYAGSLMTIAQKLGGDFGERMLRLTQSTVTGVMVGIVGTAAAQAVVGMIGYLIAGVPGVIMLTFATFLFSMVPVIGPTLIWGGAAAWLYSDGQTGWAIFMLLWGMLAISGVDNFVKPILISRTSSLPLLLIIVGVFGGVLVFGFIGLFLGPALLALGQALVREWMGDGPAARPSTELP